MTHPNASHAPTPASGATAAPETLHVTRGTCYAVFAYDVGFSVDLNEAERRITASQQREHMRHKRRAPYYFEFEPVPVRVMQQVQPVVIGRHTTTDAVDAVIYDFGAISVIYNIPLNGPLTDLLTLSCELWDHVELAQHARRVVDDLLRAIAPSVTKLAVSPIVEDYAIYQVEEFSPQDDVEQAVRVHAPLLAQILRAEDVPLSDQEINDTLAWQLSFSPEDRAVVDWNAALLFDRDADDVRAVLEFANVELLEMRYLDDNLDKALDQAYEALAKRSHRRYGVLGTRTTDLWRIAEMQMDYAMLFEGVNNTLKLLGDQYLARVYRITSQRFHLGDWDASILRKLNTIESIYEKISDQQANFRIEVLEWIIILLIAAEIVLMLIPGLLH